MNRTPALLFLFIIFITSCQKEISPDNRNTLLPNASADSNYLYKMYYIEDDGIAIDTTDIYTYMLDDLKRVTQLIDSSDDNTSQLLLPYNLTQYYYHGSDTLPYKYLQTAAPDNLWDFDTSSIFFTYNNAGLVISDSFNSIDHGISGDYFNMAVGTYQYSGNMIFGSKNIVDRQNGNTANYTERDTAQTDANGNIISNIRRRETSVSTVGYSTITWDNNPSPFAKLSNFRTVGIFPFGETFFNELPGKNNRLHITEHKISNGGSPFDYEEDLTGKYTYNASGYPTQIIDTDPSTPGVIYKIIFVYKSL